MRTDNLNDKQAILVRKNKRLAILLGLVSAGIYFTYILAIYLTGAN